MADADVAAEGPAVLHGSLLLAGVAPIATAGRTANGEASGNAVRHLAEVFVDDARLVPSDGCANESRAYRTRPRRNENVRELCGAEAVEKVEAGTRSPFFGDVRRQRLPGADAASQRRQVGRLQIRTSKQPAIQRRH